MTPHTEADERAAKIAHLTADTEHKQMPTKWEPWKAMAVAAGAGATFMVPAVAAAGFVLSHLAR